MKRHVVLQIPYHLARTPLAMLDATLGSRLPAGAVARRAVTRLLGTLDSVTGRLIDGRPVAPPSAEPSERVHGAERAAARPVRSAVSHPATPNAPAKPKAASRRAPTA